MRFLNFLEYHWCRSLKGRKVSDWTHIRFLEIAENLKHPLKAITRTPSTSLAREVGVCPQQGRLFFQSAERSGLEIRPLLLFYGTLAFAKALVVGRNQQSLSTLPKSHGVWDVSSPNACLTELTVRIGSSGTFQRFNDVAAQLNQFEYYDQESMPQGFTLPASGSAQLQNFQFTLQDILSRIPGLDRTYRRTFREPANVESLSIQPVLQTRPSGSCESMTASYSLTALVFWNSFKNGGIASLC